MFKNLFFGYTHIEAKFYFSFNKGGTYEKIFKKEHI